ncbi:MAG: HAD family phosphatase [Nitrospirae bacterium]|nr:HAD family phosphatase [Nitrospirota bacterium]
MRRQLKAVIFDFDGVLADTEPTHMRMIQHVLAEEGLHLGGDDYFRRYIGLTDHACFSAVYQAHGRSVSSEHLEALVARKSRCMLRAFKTDSMIPEAVKQFVLDAAERYRLAIASCALREEIEFCLDQAGLLDVFEHVTAAQDVVRGKPFPDPYVHCLAALMRRQMIATDDCIAIEDTPKGIQAAKAAGLVCLGVATTVAPDALALADLVAPSLDRIDLGLVAERLMGRAGRVAEAVVQGPARGVPSSTEWEMDRLDSEAQCRNSWQVI